MAEKKQNGIFDSELVKRAVDELGITDLGNATIGQVVLLARKLEKETGIPFIRMDQGSPGLKPNEVGIRAEAEAHKRGVAAQYPPAEGVTMLKEESSRFIKAFLDVDVSPEGCVPVTGSVTGSFGAFIMCSQITPGKDKILFIDPGFPIQKSQLAILGIKYESFDIFNYRGKALKAKLESYLEKGDISGIVYSNPNNPAWISLNEEELEIIGILATKYDVIVLEDLAYFAMDFRKDLSHPFQAPFQVTVAKYTDNYILMLSGSKIFSYAGQRVAIVAISDKIFNRHYPALAERYGGTGEFGSTMIAAVLYMITSGTTHTVQYALAEMYKEASDGNLNFVEDMKEYGRRAAKMKKLFTDNGFHIVYEKDIDQPIGDGFFFTIGYKDMSSSELMRELIYYGISAITLTTTGSDQQGIRACTSRMRDDMYDVLAERLKAFNENH